MLSREEQIDRMHSAIEVADRIEMALAKGHGLLAIDDIVEGVATGAMELWRHANYVMVTEVIDYPKKRVVFVHAAEGELESIQEVAEGGLVEYAQEVGASGILFAGRYGWVKALKAQGYGGELAVLFREV